MPPSLSRLIRRLKRWWSRKQWALEERADRSRSRRRRFLRSVRSRTRNTWHATVQRFHDPLRFTPRQKRGAELIAFFVGGLIVGGALMLSLGAEAGIIETRVFSAGGSRSPDQLRQARRAERTAGQEDDMSAQRLLRRALVRQEEIPSSVAERLELTPAQREAARTLLTSTEAPAGAEGRRADIDAAGSIRRFREMLSTSQRATLDTLMGTVRTRARNRGG